MKQSLFHTVSHDCSKLVTNSYSTSFSLATKMLSSKIRYHIYNIYGFVRFADEIVDTFHGHNKEMLLDSFIADYYKGLKEGISLNPILNSFIHTVKKFSIDDTLVQAFLKSMRTDLLKKDYLNESEYKEYIYGSADVVGLMCLRVFVNGNNAQYDKLKEAAMRLGSAFQKVNFLRDLKEDFESLERSYFPNVDLNDLNEGSKKSIIDDIESDFQYAYQHGILQLPVEAKFGVFMAYRYYRRLLLKLKDVHYSEIMETRIRISDTMKINLLARSYVKYKLNLI